MSRNVQDIIRTLNANPTAQQVIRPAAPAKRPAPAKAAVPIASVATAKRAVVPAKVAVPALPAVASVRAAAPIQAAPAAPVVPAKRAVVPVKVAAPVVAAAPMVAPAKRPAPMIFNAPRIVGKAALREAGFGPLLDLVGAGAGAGARQISVEEGLFAITKDFRTIAPGRIQASSSTFQVKAKNLKKSLEFTIDSFDHYAEGTVTIQGNNEERRFTDKKSLQEYINQLADSPDSPRP